MLYQNFMSTRYEAAVEEGEVVLPEDEWAKGEQ